MRTMSRIRGVLGMAAGLLAALAALSAQQQPPASPIVYVVPIEGIIDLGLAPFIERVLQEATIAQAAAVVLESTRWGGAWMQRCRSVTRC